MPGASAGNIRFDAELNGKKLVAESKIAGEAAGEAAQEGFNERFSANFSKIGKKAFADLKNDASLQGDVVAKAFLARFQSRISGAASNVASAFLEKGGLSEFAKGFDSADEAAIRLSADLQDLADAGKISKESFTSYDGALNQWLGSAHATENEALRVKNAMSDLGDELHTGVNQRMIELAENEHNVNIESDRVSSSIQGLGHDLAAEVENHTRVNDAFGTFNERLKESEAAIPDVDERMKGLNETNESGSQGWSSLSANARQWILIIGAIVSGSGEIAVLLEAVGAALFTAAQAALAAAAGTAVLAAGFILLFADTKDLAPQTQKVAAAFKDLLDPLKALGDEIANHVFAGTIDDVKALGGLITDLSGSVLGLADIANGVLKQALTAAFDPTNIALFNDLITGAGPIFASVADAAGQLLLAILNIAKAAEPFAAAFATGLDQLLSKFNAFVSSAEGQKAVTGFFASMQPIIGDLITLIGAASKAIFDLVTPTALKNTQDFLGNLIDFLPALSGLLNVLSNVDVFGIIAVALKTIGDAIKPLLPSLGDLATSLSGALKGAIKSLGPVISDLATALPPLITAIAEEFPKILPVVLELIQQFTELIGPVLPPLVDLLIALLPTLLLVIEAFDTFAPILEAVNPFITIIAQLIGALVETLADLLNLDFADLGQPWVAFWQGLPTPVTDFISTVIGAIGGWVVTTLGMFQDFFTNTVGMFVDFFTNTVGMFVDFFTNTVGMFVDFGTNAAAAWNNFWGGVAAVATGAFNGVVSFVRGIVNSIIDLINGMIGAIDTAISKIKSATGGVINFALIPKIQHLAAGGILDSATMIAPGVVAGEAGSEAIVPLNRPLDQVSASVRALSAFAQGKGGTAYSPDGPNARNGAYFAEGAIQLKSNASDNLIVAKELLDAIAENAG